MRMSKKIILFFLFFLISGCTQLPTVEPIDDQKEESIEQQIIDAIYLEESFNKNEIENITYQHCDNQIYNVHFSHHGISYECQVDIEHHQVDNCHDIMEREICEVIKDFHHLDECEIITYELSQNHEYKVTYHCDNNNYDCLVDIDTKQVTHLLHEQEHHQENHHDSHHN